MTIPTKCSLAYAGFEAALDGARLFAFFERGALVVQFFALAQRNAQLDVAPAGEHFQRYDGSPLLFGFEQGSDLAALGQQFAVLCLLRFAHLYAAGAADGGIYQPQLTVFYRDIRAAQLAMTQAQRLGL